MDRNFLKELGLEKDVIDKILDQNGSEITALKAQLKTKDVEINTLRNDLSTANTNLAELQKVDVEDLKTQLANEKAGRLKDKQNYQLNSLFSSAGCKDIDYLLYKLGDKVQFDENGAVKDKDNLLETCKKDYASLFETEPTGFGARHGSNLDKEDGVTQAFKNLYPDIEI